METTKLLLSNSIPTPVELAVKLRDTLKTRASDGAMFLQQLHYWTLKEEGILRQGVRWIWNTYKGWLAQFSWWSEWDFRVITKALRGLGLIEFEQWRDCGRDRTGCYRINYEHEWLQDLSAPICSPVSDAIGEHLTTPTDACATDRTETTPEITTQIKPQKEKNLPIDVEQTIEKYYDQLKYYQIYPLIWQNDVLIENPQFIPVRRALTKIERSIAERAIEAFLRSCRSNRKFDNLYGALAAAIYGRWGG
ncbi:MAG: hypothetical protein CLLPBCKN_006946 [Chroococcidiopsis cubana SAG 39.79]|nr:hypothetical protein [Chroococcidiopsis cubana]MDZ4877511.1 hypothetical protein [Chroococcidiopsis cubana SAG 39.79]PSB59990.1 hypothetical protein C7B79_27445 [Chroococcidiopsis cubana CCALA 043]